MSKKNQDLFAFVDPRPTVEVHLTDKRVICGPRGAPVGDFLHLLNGKRKDGLATDGNGVPIVGAVVNGELRELHYPIRMDSKVRPVSMSDEDGMLFYRRALTFLLDAAFEEVFPEASLTIDHSVSSGGYYCRVDGGATITQANLELLEEHMRGLVEQDLPFIRREAPIDEAVAYFEAKGYDDKVRLLRHRYKDYLVLYRLGDHQDYLHGYMVPSSGYLKWFGLALIDGGFTLLFPRRHSPTEINATPAYPKLLKTFRQYGEWLDRLGISNVGILNDSIKADKTSEVILVSEAMHEQFVSEIATQITNHRDLIHIILIAGPSSSGKTTFSKRLTIQLLSQGISPFPLEMDNYFVDRDATPRDENGQFDYESLGALNTRQMSDDLRHLIAGEQVQLPHYDFYTGASGTGDLVQLKPGQIIILEGIHGLNPDLLPAFPVEQTFRIYVSCLTQLNLDRHNRISTTDTRLMRRIVRDARERGYSARDTILRWESVRAGEKRNIFPYQENADVMFNSALAYEMSVLKPLVEPLLRQVPFGTAEYIESKRLLALLEWFLPVDSAQIPGNSILREFIGGSNLKNFKLWAAPATGRNE